MEEPFRYRPLGGGVPTVLVPGGANDKVAQLYSDGFWIPDPKRLLIRSSLADSVACQRAKGRDAMSCR